MVETGRQVLPDHLVLFLILLALVVDVLQDLLFLKLQFLSLLRPSDEFLLVLDFCIEGMESLLDRSQAGPGQPGGLFAFRAALFTVPIQVILDHLVVFHLRFDY